ncbi:HTH domain-containing protein [Staphylococcus ureilyticus]|nr:HTH domain-containing protein [Staphylococcus ureilyticus]MDU0462306.1 HTH domain-containing protein [Staphylococcus ureilyticus]
MDRAFRILTIYNRLLQNKSVNKQSLTLELDTSPRTIQRDIDDIRNFLYESKSWISIPKEITYDYKLESYKLEQDKSENMYFMYDILTALYLTKPKLRHYFYQYLKLLIIKHYSDNRTTLLKYLERFEIDKNQIGISTSSLVVQAMNKNQYLQYHQKLLLPLSMYYQMYAFHLVYRMDDEIYIDDISQMNLSLSEKPVDIQEKTKGTNLYYF